jgi:hypothetical protein
LVVGGSWCCTYSMWAPSKLSWCFLKPVRWLLDAIGKSHYILVLSWYLSHFILVFIPFIWHHTRCRIWSAHHAVTVFTMMLRRERSKSALLYFFGKLVNVALVFFKAWWNHERSSKNWSYCGFIMAIYVRFSYILIPSLKSSEKKPLVNSHLII